MNEIKLLKISSNCLEYYKKNVDRNKKMSVSVVQRKMTRNMLLGLPYKMSKGKTWYAYGSLRFAVRDDVVEWMENNHSPHPKWKKDMQKYKMLCDKLGIFPTYQVN